MTVLLFVVAVVLVAWGLAGFGAPLWLWTAAVAAAAVVAGGVSWFAVGIVAPLLLLCVPAVRRTVLAAPLRALTRRLLPPISDTEREALEAGTVWWDAELFSGRPDFARLLDLTVPGLTADEQAFLDGPVEELCGLLDDWAIGESGDLPPEVWAFLKSNGFFGMILPKEHGGLGFSAMAHSAVVTKISARSLTGAVTVMVPNSLGPGELLLHYGTDEQRKELLPRLARGEEIPCFALTGPTAGSDAASMPDRGVVCRGDDGTLGMRVTWDKRYITLAPVATLIGLAFRLYDPDKLLGDTEDLGITVALVPADHPGVEIGRRHRPCGQAFQNGPTRGTDVFMPLDWIVGGQERAGQGWRMLMDCLAEGRAISLPALSTGGVKLAARLTGAYARVRRQFNLPIGRFEGIEEPLARLATDAYALEAARRVTAAVVDQGEKPSVLSALLKFESTERMRRAANDAMDVHAGRGVCDGPSNYLSNLYLGAPIGITVEGANILTRTLIVFGQGALRAHPWLRKLMEAAQDQDRTRGVAAFDAALGGHVRFALMTQARALFHNVTGGRFARGPGRWFRQLTRASVSFAAVADAALLLLGGGLKRAEKLSGRFADALGAMYLMSCSLKRFEDEGRPAEDAPLLEAACRRALFDHQEALRGVLDNLPVRPAAFLLKRIVFPWGRRRRPPSDRLGRACASILMRPGAARDRLTGGVFVGFEAAARVETAFEKAVKVDELERRVHRALRERRAEVRPAEDRRAAARRLGLLADDEAERLADADAAAAAAIRVDDFEP